MVSRTSTSIPSKKQWTDEELMALPRDGYKRELLGGEIVMSPAGYEHGRQVARLSAALLSYVDQNKLGDVVDGQSGFRMKSGDVLCPDISFVSSDRLAVLGRRPAGFFLGAPDLAIEVISPGERKGAIERKLQLYFDNGARLAWLIDARHQTVAVYQSATQMLTLKPGDFLEGGTVVPDFRFAVERVFAGLDHGKG